LFRATNRRRGWRHVKLRVRSARLRHAALCPVKLAWAALAFNRCEPKPRKEFAMSVFKDLFASDVGLMSLVVLLIVLGMGAFYVRFFLRHMREDERRARAEQRSS
jgi:hypothetical protein